MNNFYKPGNFLTPVRDLFYDPDLKFPLFDCEKNNKNVAAENMRIFISYENRTHEALAEEVASQLKLNGCNVWFDKNHRRTLLRRFARGKSDFGLDGWLRKGLYRSNFLIVIIPYIDSHSVNRPEEPRDITDIVGLQITKLYESYSGRASSKWDDPTKLDRLGYYLVHPIHFYRMAWYDARIGFPLGKDPFEQWRQWEMRVAGYMKLNVLAVVPVDAEDDHFTDEVSVILDDRAFITVVSRAKIQSDITEKLLPAVKNRFPSEAEGLATKQKLRKIRSLERRLFFKIASFTTIIISIIALIGIWLAIYHLTIFIIILSVIVALILFIVFMIYAAKD